MRHDSHLLPVILKQPKSTWQLLREIFITDRVRSTRGGNIFSLSVCPHPGGCTYLTDSGGGGGTYSHVWMGGYLPSRSGWGGTYLLAGGGGGYLLSGVGGGVPTFWGGYLLSGLDGGYLPR